MKRYTLTISYKAEREEQIYLGTELVGHRWATSTWEAKTARPFAISRTGTRRRPAYRFKARVSGPVDHTGHGLTRFLFVGENQIGPCWIPSNESPPTGNAELRGILRSKASLLGKSVRLAFEAEQRDITVLWSSRDTQCPVTPGPPAFTVLQGQTMSCNWCVITPDPWSVIYEQKDVRFGRRFTLRRLPPESRTVTTGPAPNPVLGPGPVQATTIATARHTYVMRFQPARR